MLAIWFIYFSKKVAWKKDNVIAVIILVTNYLLRSFKMLIVRVIIGMRFGSEKCPSRNKNKTKTQTRCRFGRKRERRARLKAIMRNFTRLIQRR